MEGFTGKNCEKCKNPFEGEFWLTVLAVWVIHFLWIWPSLRCRLYHFLWFTLTCAFHSFIDITADTALSLDGTGRLDYAMRQSPKRDILLRQSLMGLTSDLSGPSSLKVKFRTRSKSGTLLHVQESSNYTTIKVKEGSTERCQRHARMCLLFPKHPEAQVNVHTGMLVYLSISPFATWSSSWDPHVNMSHIHTVLP